jgi:hypothetical protein
MRRTPRPPLDDTGSVVAPSFPPSPVLIPSGDWRIVQSSSLNCRLNPSLDAERLETLDRNDSVEVIATQADWSLIRRRTNCWVSSAYLGTDRVREPEVQETTAPARPLRAPPPRPSWVPAPRRSISAYYPNCSAARAAGAAPIRRGEPGYATHLDRDHDGIACE